MKPSAEIGDRLKPVPRVVDILTPHPIYLALSSSREKQYSIYRGLFKDELDRQTSVKISRGIERNIAVGNSEFLFKVAEMRA